MGKMKIVSRVSFVLVFGLMCSSGAIAQAMFTLESIPGSKPNTAISINNKSQVIVNAGVSNSDQVSTWSRLGGAADVALSGPHNVGASINSTGEIAGVGDPSSPGTSVGFLWRPSGGTTWIGSLGGGYSVASGVNDSGTVVGASYTSAFNQHPFLWTSSGGMQDLMPSITSLSGGTAVAVNSSNQVVGYYTPNGTRTPLGFVWSQAGGVQNIGLPGTISYALNDAGTVVGQTTLASGFRHAFSWTSSGGLTDLGELGGGFSTALSINKMGWIVGTSPTSTSRGLLHGFLWIPGVGMQDLTTVAGLSAGQQPYSMQVNDVGVIAMSSNHGAYLIVPKMLGTLTSSVNPSNPGQAVTFTITITSIVGPPPDGETVEFFVNNVQVGTSTTSGGVATFTTSSLAAGNHFVTTEYVGDANFLPTKFTGVSQAVK